MQSTSYGPVHMRSKASNIFGYEPKAAPLVISRRSSTIEPDVDKRVLDLAEQIRLTGCTNYNSRRLLEMYSNDTVLKVAKLNNNSVLDKPKLGRIDIV